MHTLLVQGMTCGHCVRAVTEAIQAQDPQAQVEVSLSDGRVQVHSTLEVAALARLIEAQGYTARPA
ncbi:MULTISPECIES: heavy-metal-associated domain-containing protein [unclassified Pseudomonas]|uniref:heavy-metal-associated domain-containing protein n=1 Tax=unclassified Pseudomonas TaxID=196821 RepID=UPI000BCC7802|nr:MULTISPECIES: cation transporter [unclassified Pseudomonas]PVZ09802.1 copper chaperone [Pseudomonas sp. URIL14HWK12:I12]PVZ21442.1 copper chaperone [Pseudomonas sp. URIL14HWK12:I10]PVZ30377.1 copper chaperone [Pseudomonas sp. URIL14HWK12:I11]SNZ18674.1 copper chaperone [Pseudomonas sp. URIL14HWK12:I9]